MDWRLDKNKPLCPQICDRICVMIASGELKAGERLSSVREVALEAGVTTNTVQKSYEQLEHKGVIYSKRRSGWFVSDNSEIAQQLLDELIHQFTVDYLNNMLSLGLDKKEIIQIIRNFRYS